MRHINLFADHFARWFGRAFGTVLAWWACWHLFVPQEFADAIARVLRQITD